MTNYIDAHAHVWTDDYDRYPLGPAYKPANANPPTVLPDQVLGHARPCGVNRIVLVQMSYYQDDNRYMTDVIRQYDGVFAGIGIVDPQGDDPIGQMRRLADQQVYGFRVQPKNDVMDQWLDGDGYTRMFRAAADQRQAICPLISPNALPALARRCAEFPDTPVIIDHICLIGASGQIHDDDVAQLCAMAQYPAVMVKISAFYALGRKQAPYDDLGDLIHRIYQSFGPARLMWASDAPYQFLKGHTYADSVALMEDHLDFISATDRDQIMRATAEDFFFNR